MQVYCFYLHVHRDLITYSHAQVQEIRNACILNDDVYNDVDDEILYLSMEFI